MRDDAPPLLTLANLRVDTSGAVVCEGVCAELSGSRLVLAGEGAEAIAGAVTMSGSVVAGRLTFAGFDVGAREHAGKVGIAPWGMPILPRLTVQEYVAASFRLSGVPERDAGRAAAGALTDAGVSALASRKTESLAPPERRVVLIAQAMIPTSTALFVEAPVRGLEGPAARYVLDVLERVALSRRWLATASQLEASAPERELMMAADRVAVLSRRTLVWEGTPDALMRAGVVYVVAARGEVAAFRRELDARGFVVTGAETRFCATIPQGRAPSEIVETAVACGAVVVELAPVVGRETGA